MLESYHGLTLTDPERPQPNRGDRHSHLLNNVPNTPENRAFWRAVGKAAKASGAAHYKVRLRGRGPRRSVGASPDSIPLAKATHFSVYLDQQSDFTAYYNGLAEGVRQTAAMAAIEARSEAPRTTADPHLDRKLAAYMHAIA